MINLIRKDLILNWNMLTWFSALAAASLLLPLITGTAIPAALVLGAFIITMASVTIVAREDRFGATAFTCSLPARRRDIIASRYCLSWIFFAAFLGLALVLGRILARMGVPAVPLSPPSVLLSMTIFTTSASVLFPMVIRFGFSGMIYTLVGLQVLGVAVLGLSQSIMGDANLQTLVHVFGIWIENIRGTLGAPLFILLLLLLLAAINVLSFYASRALFRHRDL